MARWIPEDRRPGWFKRLNHRFLIPLGFASRDLTRKFYSKLHLRRRKRSTFTTTDHRTYTVTGEWTDVEEQPMPSSKLSPFATTAVPRSPQLYMVDRPDIAMPTPWVYPVTPAQIPTNQWSLRPEGSAASSSGDSLLQWSPPGSPVHEVPRDRDPVYVWNRFSRRLELCLPPLDSPPNSPGPMARQTDSIYSTSLSSEPSGRLGNGPSRAATQTSRTLLRLPSVESGFGPPFGLSQFRGDWLRVSHNYRRSACSETLDPIPEDRQVSTDHLAPASAARRRASAASSTQSPRNPARNPTHYCAESRGSGRFVGNWNTIITENYCSIPLVLTAGFNAQEGRPQQTAEV